MHCTSLPLLGFSLNSEHVCSFIFNRIRLKLGLIVFEENLHRLNMLLLNVSEWQICILCWLIANCVGVYVILCILCRRADNSRSSEVETSVERNITCMWHVGLHYLQPFSLLSDDEHCRNVLSQDTAGTAAYFYFLLGVFSRSYSTLYHRLLAWFYYVHPSIHTGWAKKLDHFWELITFSNDELEMCLKCHFVAKIV